MILKVNAFKFRSDWPKSLDVYAKELNLANVMELVSSFKKVRMFNQINQQHGQTQRWVAPIPTEENKAVLDVIDQTTSKKFISKLNLFSSYP